MGDDNPEVDTLLYRDMYIATEFLKCTHEEFLNKPRIEKNKLRIFLNVKMRKRKFKLDKMSEEYGD